MNIVVLVKILSVFFSIIALIFSLLVRILLVNIVFTSSIYSFFVSCSFSFKSDLNELIFLSIFETTERIFELIVVFIVSDKLDERLFKISIKILFIITIFM